MPSPTSNIVPGPVKGVITPPNKPNYSQFGVAGNSAFTTPNTTQFGGAGNAMLKTPTPGLRTQGGNTGGGGIIPVANAATNSGSNQNNQNQNAGTGSAFTPDVAGNTYNGGVNQNGQNFPGYGTSFPGLVSNLYNQSNAPTPEYQAAQEQYKNANQQLADLKTAAANNQFIGAGTNMAEYAGTQGLLANRLANQENALVGEMTAAQQAAQTATGQQGTQISGLNQAAGLAAPQAANALGVFNPTQGTYNQYGGGQGSGVAQAGGVLGNLSQAQQFQQTLLPAYKAAGSILQDFGKWTNSPEGKNINPSDSNLLNQFNAWIRGAQFSDPRYPQLSQYLNEFMNTLTPIIGSPGEVTNYKQQIVNSLLNPSSSTGSLQQQLNSIYNIAGNKMNSIYQTFTNPSQGFQAVSPDSNLAGASGESSGGGVVTAGGYKFIKDASGKYVPAK